MIQIPVEPAITEYLHRKASAARIPISGTFELTPVCNMACRMCYVRMTKQQQESIAPLRSAQEWLALAAEAKKHGLLYILLTGGEPFLHPEFRQILTGLHQMGFVISINTNGTMIDESVVSWLLESPPSRVNITLYGASDETYARLCGNPKGFTQATRAIRLLTDAGFTVKLHCSVTPQNVEDFDRILDFALENKLHCQATSYMFPPLRRDVSQVGSNDRLSPEDAAYYAARIEARLGGEETFLQRTEAYVPPMSGDLEESCADVGDVMRCRAGRCSFWVTWEGKLLPCGMLPPRGEANVFEVEFLDAWQQVVQATDCIRLPAKCSSCALKDVCHSCAAMVMTETGAFDVVPEYRCRMAYAYGDARKRVKEQILANRKP